MKRKLLSFFLAITITLSVTVTSFAVVLPEAVSKDSIVILHTNDSHGRISPTKKEGGFTAVSAAKKAFEKTGAAVLLFDIGDTLHGLPAATINKGADVVAIMNLVGYDAMTPGNHDFNYGTERLAELSKTMDFPLISANTVVTETGKALFMPSVVIKKNGVSFGLFGLTTPETAYKTNPNNVKAVTFEDPAVHAAKQVTGLKKQNVDYIIALAHIGVDASSEFTSDKIAAQVPGIDLILDGHSHTVMTDGKPADEAIVLAEHGDTVIASTGEYMHNIGVVVIDADGRVSAGLIPWKEDMATDPETDALLETILAQQDSMLSEVVGTTSVKLEGAREFNRRQETNLGNLAADAFRCATGADVAFTNGGGIRASIEPGDITKKDLITVFPFGNYVVTKRVTGQAILDAMEHGVKDYPELSGGFPQVSGIYFQIDESAPAGERVVGAKIGGSEIAPSAAYMLATNDFIAAGGDGYTMFDGAAIVNEYGSMEEILIDYIKDNPGMTAAVEGRITVLEQHAKEKAMEEITIYIVAPGDSLWKIAKAHTGKGTNWTIIYEMNRYTIKNPGMIYVGQKIALPFL